MMQKMIGEPDSLQRLTVVGALLGVLGGLAILTFGWNFAVICAIGGAITGAIGGWDSRLGIGQ